MTPVMCSVITVNGSALHPADVSNQQMRLCALMAGGNKCLRYVFFPSVFCTLLDELPCNYSKIPAEGALVIQFNHVKFKNS